MKDLKSSEGYSINKPILNKFVFQGKYLILDLESEKIILISDTKKFTYHVNALYQFMIDNKLDIINVLGGGNFNRFEKSISFINESKGFGQPNESDLSDALKNFDFDYGENITTEFRNRNNPEAGIYSLEDIRDASF